jgi:translation initiation factor 3 subunit I
MKPILLRGHEKPISIVKFNFDGDLLFTGAAEKKVNLWYALSGERIGSYDTKGAVKTLDVTNDSSYMVVGTLVGSIEFFKVDGGQLLGAINLEAKIKTVQFSYGDKKLLVVLIFFICVKLLARRMVC